MQKKLEYLARNCGLATILKVLMGKHGFYNGGKSENFELRIKKQKSKFRRNCFDNEVSDWAKHGLMCP